MAVLWLCNPEMQVRFLPSAPDKINQQGEINMVRDKKLPPADIETKELPDTAMEEKQVPDAEQHDKV